MEGLSLAANIIAVVDLTAKVIERLNDFRNSINGIPRTLQALSNELPALNLVLGKIRRASDEGRIPEDSRDALKPLMTDFAEHIQAILDIIEKMRPKDNSRMARNLKAVGSFRYDGQIQYHESVIRKYAQTLSLERIVSGPEKDIAALQRPLVPTFVCPHRQDPDFIERQLLADLLAQRQPASRHALVGGAGMGKSQLAIHYGYKIQETNPNTWIFWIDAETVTNFEQGYRDIANAVRILGRNDKGADILTLVSTWLRDPSNGPWVLILDNADDKAVFSSPPSNQRLAESGKQIREFLPQSSNGSILVTSRSRDAGFEVTTNYKHVFTVEQMTEDEALTLLQSQLDDTHPVSEQKTLVEKLGYVPLAIAQAAANISRRSLPIPEYIKELDKVDEPSASLLDDSLPQLQRDASRSNSVVATWKVTFEYVRRCAPSAARLLSLMSLFARQDIPAALVEAEYGAEVIAAAKVRKVWWKRRLRRKKRKEIELVKMPCSFEDDWLMLRDFSLIKMNRDRRHFSMHPIVQFSTKRWLVEHGQLTPWSYKFISVIHTAYPEAIHLDNERCHALLAHAYATVTYRPANAATPQLHIWAQLMRRLASQHIHWAAVDTAEKLLHAAAQALETCLGPKATDTLQCNAERAMWLTHLGQHDEAANLHECALEVRFGYTGPAFAGSSDAMVEVADALAAQGRYEEADTMYTRALDKLGHAHASSQTTFNAYAKFLCSRGRYHDACEVWRRAHEARRTNGVDGVWVENLNYVAMSCLMGGKPRDAEKAYREVVVENEKGARDEGWAKGLVQLGRVLLQLEEHADAEVHLGRVMEWYDTDARRNDPYRLETIGLLAFVLWKVDKLDEADMLAQRCIGEQTDLLGEGDEETLRSRWVLAGVREKQGRLEDALEMYKRTIEGAEKWLGENSEVAKEWRGDCEALLEKMEKSAANAEGTTRVTKSDETCVASVGRTMSQDSLEDAISGAEEGRREMPLVDEKIRQESDLQPSQVILVV